MLQIVAAAHLVLQAAVQGALGYHIPALVIGYEQIVVGDLFWLLAC